LGITNLSSRDDSEPYMFTQHIPPATAHMAKRHLIELQRVMIILQDKVRDFVIACRCSARNVVGGSCPRTDETPEKVKRVLRDNMTFSPSERDGDDFVTSKRSDGAGRVELKTKQADQQHASTEDYNSLEHDILLR
jgi:hypothetical protein